MNSRASSRSASLGFQPLRKVSFNDRHLQVHIGTITRCDPKTASFASNGAARNVPYGGLRHALDI